LTGFGLKAFDGFMLAAAAEKSMAIQCIKWLRLYAACDKNTPI
jgi:hypothetical protein